MPKFTDYYSSPEIKGIMERFIGHFPGMFQGFNIDQIHVVITRKKKARKPLRLISVGYPHSVFINKPYIVEAFEGLWAKLNPKQKNLAVFHIMCAIPEGGFDEQSSHYSKKVPPDISMYLREFAASGGVPNWLENDSCKDPLEAKQSEMVNIVFPQTKEEPSDQNDTITADPIPLNNDVEIKGDVTRVPVTQDGIASVGLVVPA